MGSVRVPRVGIAALGVCSIVCSARANAQDAEAAHLTYDVPAGCPDESAFLEMVARDGGRLASAPDAPGTRSFAVHIERTNSISGRLVVREGDGTEAVREMSGIACDDVVRSLAVVVALSVQPPTPTEPASPSAATVPGFAAANLGPESEPKPFDLSDESVVLRPHQGWRVDVSFEGTLSKSSSPSNAPSLAAYVELMDETPHFFAPSIRVGGEIAADQQLDDITTTFRRIVGRVDACPWRGVFTRPWSDDAFTMQACGRVDVGRIEAEAYLTYGGHTFSNEARRLWIAPAGVLRFRWTSPGFFLEAEVGATFPLLRERFHVQSSEEGIFEIPAIAATTGLGVGFFL